MKLKRLSDARVASISEKDMVLQYAFYIESLESVSDEWLNASYWSSPIFGVFIIE